MAAVRQKEMKVNITLVTTSTCRVVGPRRLVGVELVDGESGMASTSPRRLSPGLVN
jgi:hypothetical protein